MLDIQNIGLVELNALEVQEVEGGMMLAWGWCAGAFALGFGAGSAIVYYNS